MRILTVVGARPQFIKAATVSQVIKGWTGTPPLREVLVHTGQHHDPALSDIFFRELGLKQPDHWLGVAGGSHGEMTGRMLEKLDAVIVAERPDVVLVYGDTNSTLAGALAAAKLKVPLAHVEAGLRSFNRGMPEEINRVVADHCSQILFCPTRTAVANLEQEGIARGIHLVGDVMYDAALRFGAAAESSSQVLSRLRLSPKAYVLATVHRAENTDDPERLQTLLGALEKIAQTVDVVLPIHPRTRKALDARGAHGLDGLRIVEPLGFFDMLVLEKNARLIATDSGGMQKEAYFYGVPCVTLRGETEWVELLECGYNRLAPPTDAEAVVAVLRSALTGKGGGYPPAALYGDGRAAEKIVDILSRA